MTYVVRDQKGDTYAIRKSYAEAEVALGDAADYLAYAAACGHPAAPAWVRVRLPLVIVWVDLKEQLDTFLADSTPILDREP